MMKTHEEIAAPPSRGISREGSSPWRRAWLIALAAAVLLLTAGIVLAISNERDYRAQKIDEVSVEGRFLALIVTAALDFNDRAAAQEYLDALKANPEADAAAIYDAHGRIFASYRREAAPALPATAPPAGAAVAGDRLLVPPPGGQG